MMGVMVPVVVKRRMSEEEYFELLEKSGERMEYWDGVVEGMAGGSVEHCAIEPECRSWASRCVWRR